MTIGNTISTAGSGLRANARRVAVAADNIANVTTPGFVPSEVVSTSVVAGAGSAPGGVGVRTSLRPTVVLPADVFDVSLVDVADEFARLTQAHTAYKAGVSLLRTSDQMLRTTLSETA